MIKKIEETNNYENAKKIIENTINHESHFKNIEKPAVYPKIFKKDEQEQNIRTSLSETSIELQLSLLLILFAPDLLKFITPNLLDVVNKLHHYGAIAEHDKHYSLKLFHEFKQKNPDSELDFENFLKMLSILKNQQQKELELELKENRRLYISIHQNRNHYL